MENTNQHIDIELLTRFLAGETSEEESQLVHSWKEAKVENRIQFDELHEAWKLMDKTSLQSDIDVDAEWKYHLKIIHPQRREKTIIFRNLVRIAAAIIVGIGLVYYGLKLSSNQSLKTQTAETREFTLPDGSKVTLNAGSKLTYTKDFGKLSRIVSLKGEGYFEIKKNPDKPFIIDAGDATIKVLGTTFNVKAYKNMENIEVTVKEGKVSLFEKNTEAKKVIATAGEKAEYVKKLNIVKKQVNENRNYISWKTHLIIFENDNLSLIIETLQDVYHKKIVLSNPELGKCTITTTFDNKGLGTVLRVLESTLDIKFNEKEDIIVISGKGC